jgi:hypothetical protein
MSTAPIQPEEFDSLMANYWQRRWKGLLHSLSAGVTRRGIALATAFPTMWIIVSYMLVGHVWMHLGRWPHFGETVGGWILDLQNTVIWWGYGMLILSLMVTPLALIGCLLTRGIRHWAVYVLCHAAAAGLAIGLFNLAPAPFLNWFYD